MADETEGGGGSGLPPQGRREFIKTTVAVSASVIVGCGGDDEPARTDAGGTPDGGPMPADGSVDSGPIDGGTRDAGLRDGGAPDDAATDASDPDASMGTDAPPEDTPEAMFGFALGIASGDVTATSAILWTRYDGSAPLRLVVWEMDGEAYVRRVHDAEATPVDAFVHVDVTTLSPGLRYRYAFFEMDGEARMTRSPIGRFRAALADTTLDTVVIAGCSCTNNSYEPRPLEHAGTRSDIDAFLLLGDTTYNDSATTLDAYRGRWQGNLSKPGYRAMRAATSVLATWDDHEVTNDFDPETVSAARVAIARQTFFEHLPLRRDAASPDRIWKSMRWGGTVEIFVLDCRSERRPSTRETAMAEYLSRAQMDWLKTSLAASPCVFKLIANSVPISDFPFPFDFSSDDRWEGYRAQREEILRYVDETPIPGVLWVAGDFHLASMGRIATSGPGASAIEVLVGPGAQIPNPGYTTLRAPQFDWASGTNNYATMSFDPSTRTVTLRYYDGGGGMFAERSYTL